MSRSIRLGVPSRVLLLASGLLIAACRPGCEDVPVVMTHDPAALLGHLDTLAVSYRIIAPAEFQASGAQLPLQVAMRANIEEILKQVGVALVTNAVDTLSVEMSIASTEKLLGLRLATPWQMRIELRRPVRLLADRAIAARAPVWSSQDAGFVVALTETATVEAVQAKSLAELANLQKTLIARPRRGER